MTEMCLWCRKHEARVIAGALPITLCDEVPPGEVWAMSPSWLNEIQPSDAPFGVPPKAGE